MADDLTYTEKQYSAILFMQQTYNSSGHLPTAELIAEKVGATVTTVKGWLELKKFQIAMERLDIPWYDKADGSLTALQLAVVEIMLNLSDRRSEREKCQEAGITVAKYNAWLRDPAFAEYVNARARRMFGEVGEGMAYTTILRNMRNGDMSATKIYLEMTGKYMPSIRQHNTVNLEGFVAQLVELLQRRLQGQPELMEQLARDLENLLQGRPIDFDSLPPQVRDIIPVPSIEMSTS